MNELSVSSSSRDTNLTDPADAIAEFVELTGSVYWETDAELLYTHEVLSSRLARGLDPGTYIGQTRWEAAGVDPECDESWRSHRDDLLARRPFTDFAFSTRGPDGGSVHWLASGRPCFDAAGVFLGYRGVSRDVTDLVESVATAERHADVIDSVLANLPCMVFRRRMKPDGRLSYDYLRMHPAIASVLGDPADGATAHDMRRYMEPGDLSRFLAAVRRSCDEMSTMTFEYRAVVPVGAPMWVRSVAVPRRMDDGDVVWDGVAIEVTETRALSERLAYLKRHDEETGLPNRTSLCERVDAALRFNARTGASTIVVVAELRASRMVAALGGTGYRGAVAAFAERVGQMNGDVAATARLGDREFGLVLFPRKGDAAIVDATRRVVARLGKSFVLDDVVVVPALAIGAAVHPGDGSDADTLIGHAASAAAIHDGHRADQVTFYSRELEQQIATAYSLEGELRLALARDEFTVAFQPVVEIADRAMVGAEALIRWNHPERGLLYPDAFIEVAERAGLIAALDRITLRRTCAAIRDWRATGLRVPPVSVNVSALNIEEPGFRSELATTLAEFGLAPGTIKLELTERSFLNLQPATLEMIAGLVRDGTEIAIDDFGTGYSTLANFVALPATTIKIDRSFVEGLGLSNENAVVVEAVCTMSRALGRRIVAEGVEREEQVEILRAFGCHDLQGHLTGRPLALGTFAQLLEA